MWLTDDCNVGAGVGGGGVAGGGVLGGGGAAGGGVVAVVPVLELLVLPPEDALPPPQPTNAIDKPSRTKPWNLAFNLQNCCMAVEPSTCCSGG